MALIGPPRAERGRTCCRRQRCDHGSLVAHQIFLGGGIHLIERHRILFVDDRVDQIGIVEVHGVPADQVRRVQRRPPLLDEPPQELRLGLGQFSAVTPFFATAAISSSIAFSRSSTFTPGRGVAET